ncbi:hypothetical protein E2C01_030590 [Portunus trituberculatus]|uniref:Uncharacterized protein n=1 Tax=Portunus trituberculatus TaxID=210409 RepID=A0A5B7EV87_PORTR|nr:hypothetical protein [Portunus trituberculatus]
MVKISILSFSSSSLQVSNARGRNNLCLTSTALSPALTLLPSLVRGKTPSPNPYLKNQSPVK